MSEAPKCDECPIFPHGNQTECGVAEIREMGYPFPGPECPFVRLDAKDGEILVLKNQLLKAQREATELRGLLDEHDIDITTEID